MWGMLAAVVLRFKEEIMARPPLTDSLTDSSSSPARRAEQDTALRSSVRLLETRSGAFTSELLGLAAARVGNKQGLVVLKKELLEFTLGGLVLVLLGVGNDTLGDGLADGQHLGVRTGAANADANVEVLELGLAEKKHGLPYLQSHRDGLHNVQRLSIDTNISFAGGDGGDGSGILLPAEGLHDPSFLHT